MKHEKEERANEGSSRQVKDNMILASRLQNMESH